MAGSDCIISSTSKTSFFLYSGLLDPLYPLFLLPCSTSFKLSIQHQYLIQIMTIPSAFNGSIHSLHYYQGVLVAEVALTLLIYLLLKVIHYVKWGHDEQASAGGEQKQEEKKDGEQDGESRKWDQKAWNVYFPIIFTNHVGAIALIIVYIPYTFACVIGFLHFLCFIALIILNICIKDAEPGNGSRTKGTRVVWGIMCFFNLMLIVGGLSGVSKVYVS